MNSIKDYLEGNISDEELELISDQLINAKFDQEKRKDWIVKLSNKHGVNKKRGDATGIVRFKKQFIFGIAASLILLFSFFFIFSNTGTPKYMHAVNEQISRLKIMGDQSILRKGPQELEQIRTDATLSYVNKKYVESINYWELITQSPSATGMDFFYLGLCQLQQPNSNPDKAIESFKKSSQLNGPKPELAWVFALSYLKSGDVVKGQEQLQQIVNNKGYKQDTAKKLLELLK